MGYLKHTVNYGLVYAKPHHEVSSIRILQYCDSDHAGATDRVSHSGSMILQEAGSVKHCVNWVSKRQSSVSLSSTEAEICAIVDALRGLDEVIDLIDATIGKREVVILVDNDAAASACRRGYSQQITYMSKTRSIQLIWIPSYILACDAVIERIHTSENVSDMQTKILGRVALQNLLLISGVGNVIAVKQD